MTFEQGEIILYQSDDGQAAVDVRLKDETVWLTLNQISELFDRDKSVISRHLKNIFKTDLFENISYNPSHGGKIIDNENFHI